LFCIGQEKKLLKDDPHLDNILSCKFGFIEDENNFKKEYGKENMNFSLLLYSIIDPQYIFEAEMGVKDYFKTDKLVKDGKSETVLIDKNNISKIRQYYKMVQNQYIGRYKEMNERIKKLEKKFENEKHRRELENETHKTENEKHQRELENEKHKTENEKHLRELENEKHKNEILRMKLEIMGLKNGMK
jgi:membrane protein involved in colicin uptake